MPSYMTANQNTPLVLPPPVVLSRPEDANAWYVSISAGQRQAFMNYVTTTVNRMSPAKKRGLERILAKQGLTLDSMRQEFPGIKGLGILWGELLSVGTSLYLADNAQDSAAADSAEGRRLQRQLNEARLRSDESMNQAVLDAQAKAAQLAAGSANQANQLQTYTAILSMQMQADTKAKRQEMFGPVWAKVITYGGAGLLVILGGGTFMYMRRRKRRK